ncbi:MAG: hypothetical protein KC492_10640, partial [Myxococcales bacterium]|nr:hypothetical protein [Myxococcales bacterium]
MIRAALAALVLLVALGGHGRAQLPNLLEVSGQYMPWAPLDALPGARAQLASYDAALNVPIVLGETSFLIPGLAVHADAIAFDGVPAGFTGPRALFAVDLALLYVQLLPDDWALALRVAPGLAGDFQAVDSGMLRLSFVAQLGHTFSEKFSLGGGIIGSYAFGNWLPLPALYIGYDPLPWLSFETFIPAFARLVFRPHARLELS